MCKLHFLLLLEIVFCITLTSAQTPGSPDLTFNFTGKLTNNIGGTNDVARAMKIQADGKIVVGGTSNANGNSDFALVRYNADGSIDQTFGGGLVLTPIGNGNNNLYDLAIQSDGKIVVAGDANNGTYSDFAAARYNVNGTPDSSFGINGIITQRVGAGNCSAYALTLQCDGKIILGGYSRAANTAYQFAWVRYNANGAIDSTFGLNGVVEINRQNQVCAVTSLLMQPDGKILSGGYWGSSVTHFAISRFNSVGMPDSTFGTNGMVILNGLADYSYCTALALQPDGKIVAGGSTGVLNDFEFVLARYTPTGTLDVSFNGDGIAQTLVGRDARIEDIKLQSDGKILACGTSHNFFGSTTYPSIFTLLRYKNNGDIDSTFGTNGKVTTAFGNSNEGANALELQANGRIVLAGYSTGTDFALARYTSDYTNCNEEILICTQPQNQSVCPGQNTTLTALAINATSSQWQDSTLSGWHDITGGTESVLTITNVQALQNGTGYRCILKNKCDSDTTLTAVLNVGSFVLQPINQTICAGSYFVFSDDTLWTGGTYFDTLPAISACDTVIRLVLSVTQPNAALLPALTSICAGDTAVLTAPAGISFSWNTGDTTQSIAVTQPGPFYVTITDTNSCIVISDTAFVHVTPLPAAPVITQLPGNKLVATGAYNFQWFLNGMPINNGINDTLLVMQTGSYAVQITDSNGCKAMSDTLNLVPLNLEDAPTSVRFLLYPNPGNGYFMLTCTDNLTHQCRIANALGQTVWEQRLSGQKQLQLGHLPAGIYYLSIDYMGGKPFIIEK